MKILKLRLTNINALKGCWQIDFADQAFDYGGIFAIIGQTGAGKTTILDAICLALYGATPRLDKITKSDNALMSLGTGHCSAEVWLLVNHQHYHFYFAQHRAKMKADGTLQEPKREISRIHPDGNVLLAEKTRQVETLAVEILGMDFAQFTRSVMLAQGNFCAFLQSETHKRGEILEKITGTDIYAKLSILAYDTHREKQNALKQKQAQLDKMDIMDEQAFERLKQSLDEQQHDIEQKKQMLDTLTQKIQDKQSLEKEQQTLSQLTREHMQAQQALDDFAHQLDKLTLAQKLLPLAGDFDYLNAIRQQIDTENKKYEQNQKEIIKLSQDTKQAEQNYQHHQDQHDTLINNTNQRLQIIKQVREMDMRLHFLQDNYQKACQEFEKQHTTWQQLQQNQQACQEMIANHQAACQKLQENINAHQALQHINLTWLAMTADKWCDGLTTLCADAWALEQKQQHIEHLRENLTLEQQKLTQAQQVCIELTNDLTNIQTNIREYLPSLSHTPEQNADLPEAIAHLLTNHQNKIQHAISIKHLQSQLQDDEQAIATHQNALTNAQNAQQDYQNQHQKHQDTLTQQTALLDSNKDKLAITRRHHELQLQLHSLQTHFDALTQGKPCPLCGSLTHPYKTDQKPPAQQPIAQTQNAILELESRQQQIQADLEHTKRLLQDSQSHAQHQKEKITEINQQLRHHTQQKNTKWRTLYAELQQHFAQFLVKFTQTHNQPLTAEQTIGVDLLQTLMSEFYDCEQKIHAQYQELQATQKQLEQITSKLTKAQQTQERHQQQAQHHKQQIAQESERWRVCLNQLIGKLDDFAKLSTTLQNHLNKYQHNLPSQAVSLITPSLSAMLHVIYQWRDIARQTITKHNLPIFYHHAHTLSQQATTAQPKHGLQDMVNNLEKLINEYQAWQQSLDKLQTTLLLEQQKYEQYQAERHTQEQHHQIAKQQKDEQHHAFLIQQKQRQALFGDDDPNVQEQLINQAINQSQEAIKTAQIAYDQAKDNQARLTHRLAEQQESLEERHALQKSLSSNFLEKLNKLNIPDEQSYLTHRLSHEQIKALEQNHHQLVSQITQLKQQKSALQDKLATWQARYPDINDWQLSALLDDKHALQKTLDDKLTQLGADSQRLNYAQNNYLQYQAQQDDIKQMIQDISIWANLYQLIGSNDGKKYRNFAQGLTLDMMLVLANQILVKMNDRYELLRSQDEKNTLGIDVKDKYQNDTIRSSKNLSGGESFIVSLALALGLSKMNSQKIHIESLFLDEGFGTLDEEALDIALATLSELEQSGKTIGIISHVCALKERIGTQIIVEKKSNGSSVLRGAGVQFIA